MTTSIWRYLQQDSKEEEDENKKEDINEHYKRFTLTNRINDPKKQTKSKPNANQKQTKSKPNANQTQTKSKPKANQKQTKSKTKSNPKSQMGTLYQYKTIPEVSIFVDTPSIQKANQKQTKRKPKILCVNSNKCFQTSSKKNDIVRKTKSKKSY